MKRKKLFMLRKKIFCLTRKVGINVESLSDEKQN